MRKLFKHYKSLKGSLHPILLFNGRHVAKTDTPESLRLEDQAILQVWFMDDNRAIVRVRGIVSSIHYA
jgi:hypothetical protein